MLVESAVELINSGLAAKPGWKFEAKQTQRFENMIRVVATWPSHCSDRDEYPAYPTQMDALQAGFFITSADCDTVDDLVFKLLTEVILPIETHEWREFLRVHPTGWAPFHPHRVDGMNAWSKRTGSPVGLDLKFGLTRF